MDQESTIKEYLKILGSFPIAQRIHPPGAKSNKDDLLIVHSTPRSCNVFLVLDPIKPGSSHRGKGYSNRAI